MVPLDTPRKFNGEFRQINDPELAIEFACRNERNNVVAVRNGLPSIGSKLVNKFGIEWVVDGHIYAPTIGTLQSWREGKGETIENLYPSIVPQNLSDRLNEFVTAVDRCTSKTFLVLDTVAAIQRGTAIPYGNSIDTIADPDAILLFLDAARIHETIIAHEIGHAWLQYVEECEDLRVMKDASDPHRLYQFTFVQSFVLDLKVNDVLRRKGFDMSPIEEDLAESIEALGRAIAVGYRPESLREEVFMAFTMASSILEGDRNTSEGLVRARSTHVNMRELNERLAQLSEAFVSAVRDHGFQSKDELLASINACLKIAFEHTGDGIDLEHDVIAIDAPEADFDKFPDWIPGASTALKREVGRILAIENAPPSCRISFTDTGGKTFAKLHFVNGDESGLYPLENRYSVPPINRIRAMGEINSVIKRNCNQSPNDDLGRRNVSPGAHGWRHYTAGAGRWLTRARLEEQLIGERVYEYALSNPVRNINPSGMLACGSSGASPIAKLDLPCPPIAVAGCILSCISERAVYCGCTAIVTWDVLEIKCDCCQRVTVKPKS